MQDTTLKPSAFSGCMAAVGTKIAVDPKTSNLEGSAVHISDIVVDVQHLKKSVDDIKVKLEQCDTNVFQFSQLAKTMGAKLYSFDDLENR